MNAAVVFREKCSLYDLPRQFCAHCNRPTPRAPVQRYELRTSFFEGHPVAEILKNGRPIHSFDEHFRFGRFRARVLMDALPIIEQLANGVAEIRDQVLPSRLGGRQIRVSLEPDFVHSSGATIHRRWLRLELVPGDVRIGVGAEKAKAICAVSEEIERWLRGPMHVSSQQAGQQTSPGA